MIILSLSDLDKSKPIRIIENRLKLIQSIFNNKKININDIRDTNNDFKNLLFDVIRYLNKKNRHLIYCLNDILNDYLTYTDEIIQIIKLTTSDIIINDLYKMYIIKVNEYCDDVKDQILGNLKNESGINK